MEGVSFVNRRYTKGVPFLLRGRTWGRSLPVYCTNGTLLITPPPPPRVVYTTVYYKCTSVMKDVKFFSDKLIYFSVYDFGSFIITRIRAHAFGLGKGRLS